MSHIKNIEIKNFKSIKSARLEDCRRVNVLIGYPNVGKSNILEAMSIPLISKYSSEQSLYNELFRYEKNRDLFFENNTEDDIQLLVNDVLQYTVHNQNQNENFLQLGMKHLFNEFLQINIKKYSFSSTITYNDDVSYGNLDNPYGKNLPGILSVKKNLRDEIFDFFKEYNLTLLVDLYGEKGATIVVVKINEDIIKFKIPYNLISDTLRRLIFHIAAVKTNKETVILFEEPEAHMFPPYISKLTSVITNDTNDNQFFIATHSPFVLNDFMENIKNELAVFLVDYKGGETLIHRLTEAETHEAAQLGYDLFLNLKNFIPAE